MIAKALLEAVTDMFCCLVIETQVCMKLGISPIYYAAQTSTSQRLPFNILLKHNFHKNFHQR